MAIAEKKHDVFQAIADSTRRKMLRLLMNKEMSIASITDYFPISRSAVNKHLTILNDAGLVTSHKKGRETRFKIEPKPLAEVQQWVSFFERFWDEKLNALSEYVKSDDK